jgi:hypothetical protein
MTDAPKLEEGEQSDHGFLSERKRMTPFRLWALLLCKHIKQSKYELDIVDQGWLCH